MLAVVRQLLVLWALAAKMDLIFISRGLKQVLFFYLSDGLFAIAAVAGTYLLAERFDGIGPWSKPQVVFMLGYATLVRGSMDLFFTFNVSFISRRIGRGQLDHLLVQPRPLWMSLLTEGFVPFTGLTMAAIGAVLIVVAVGQLAIPATAGWLALLLLNLVGSAAVVLAFSYVIGSIAFWAPRAAEEINSSSMGLIQQLKAFPLDGAGPALRGGLLTIVPIGFVAWYPCRTLLGLEEATYAVAVTPLAGLVFGLIALSIFRIGLAQYRRTGSSRYLAHGHRR